MTNIITAVMINVFSMPRTVFVVSIQKMGLLRSTLQAHNYGLVMEEVTSILLII